MGKEKNITSLLQAEIHELDTSVTGELFKKANKARMTLNHFFTFSEYCEQLPFF